MGLPAVQLTSWSEYLEMQEASDERLEYHNGVVYNMTRGTYAHAVLQQRIVVQLSRQLDGRPCQVLGADMRIRVDQNHSGLYPDASVVCGAPVLIDEDRTLLNPKLIVEVLSPSTSAYDRGAKFSTYAMIGSLEEYLLIDHERPHLELRVRRPDGGWTRYHARSGDQLPLFSLPVELDVDTLYAGIELKPR